MARRGRRLSNTERALWDEVKKTTTPLRDKSPQAAIAEPDRPAKDVKSAAKPFPRLVVKPKGSVAPPLSVDLAPDPMQTFERPAPGMDRKRFDRLRKGKMAPDATLDLHGMTAERAKAALTGFILNARSDGLRLLLVITGKGRPGADSIAPQRIGVLRHAVPQWLQAAPLSGAVLQITAAHRSHGGGGAYYVYLRRAR